MARLTKNSFDKGINSDIDQQNLPPNFYTSAYNLSLMEDGKFLSLKNVQGTTLESSVTGGITTLLDGNVKSVVGKYTIGTTEQVNCITNFITGKEAGDEGAFYITVFDLDNSVLYYLYREQGLGTDYFDEHRIVDNRTFPENGIDIIYFTDNFNEVRQLRCVIPAGAPDYFLSEYDLSLQRRGANGTIQLVDVGVTSGTLLSGTYQYAYRCVSPTTKRFTKWSSLTSPVHVYQQNDSSSPVYSAVGASTPFAVTLIISPTQTELDQFEFYQLAVVENIYPIATPVNPAALLPIQTLAGVPATFVHSTNERIGLVPIEDLVVDLAAIKSAKTLAIKQDRLHKGNIKYFNLEMDNGTPTITGGSVVTKRDGSIYDGYSDHNFSSTSEGYFRDETYRMAAVYRDTYGNKAPAQVLDLSSITDNQITSGGIDIHFPGRNVSNNYTLFGSTGRLQGLGLSLTALHNHPTWAVGFEIVRAKRIKRILFQTPIIPFEGVDGVGAIDDYPSQAVTVAATTASALTPDAQPQTSSKVYVPKNLFWPEGREVRKRTTQVGAGLTLAEIGEVELVAGSAAAASPHYSMVFPQSSTYGDKPYVFGGFEKAEVIDLCIARLNISDFNTGVVAGDSMKTQVSGTFYSLRDGDYYFDSAWSAKVLPGLLAVTKPIKDYVFLPNLSESIVLGGNRLHAYTELNGTGVNWGYKPAVQKSGVVQWSDFIIDSTYVSASFASGDWNGYTTGGGSFIVGASGPLYQLAVGVNNNYIHEYGSFVADTSYVQQFTIVNVINDFGDDRYGPITTQHDFISTGVSYSFTESELTDVRAGNTVNINLDGSDEEHPQVFGGDCFVAPHTFKIADSAYSVVNQAKNNTAPVLASGDSEATLITKWDGKYYRNTSGTAGLSLAVGVQGAAQFVQVVLESEYNGGVMSEDIITGVTNVNGIPVMNIDGSTNTTGAIHSPLLYNYNVNLSKQNDQKVYVIKQPYSFIQYNFKSRDNYSDIKVYGTDVQGFDVFRVGNIFDLEENKGAITKLAVSGDLLYAIMETGVVYLPTSQNQIQQTDGGTLAVGTGDVLGRPIIIDQNNGGQHLNAIVETGSAIYIPDVLNKAVYRLRGTQPLERINDNNFYTSIRSYFENPIPENQLVGFYNQVDREVWFADNTNNVVNIFNENIGEEGAWIGQMEFYDATDSLSSKCIGGVYGNQRLYLLSDFTTGGRKDFGVWSMYTGDNDKMFGRTKTPRVSFVVNPDSDVSKTWDNMAFIATDRLYNMDLVVEREASLSNQVVSGISLNDLSIEGNYRIKTLRDPDRARLRGTRMLATVRWLAGNINRVALTSVLTKYRWSARSPF